MDKENARVPNGGFPQIYIVGKTDATTSIQQRKIITAQPSVPPSVSIRSILMKKKK
jgi:hypothetical protein